MSDPAFWTPPHSPEFRGNIDPSLECCEADLFLESDDITEDILLGMPCGSLDETSFLKYLEQYLKKNDWLEGRQNLSLVWNMIAQFRTKALPRPQRTCLRNDISFLLSSLSTFRNFDIPITTTVSQMRTILIYLGQLTKNTQLKDHSSFFHVHLDTWIIFLETFHHICENKERAKYANEVFGLKPNSHTDAFGYFLDIVVENLIVYFSSEEKVTVCSCIDFLWMLVIHYTEKLYSSWFKFLHGKIMKQTKHSRCTVHEPNTLERLRPDFESFLCTAGSHSISRVTSRIWSVYWLILAHTAPIHRTILIQAEATQVKPESMQKYSIVIWLIRKQFLDELKPTAEEVHTALNCLTQINDVWGTNVEVIRSLWLFYKSSLDSGYVQSNESLITNSITPVLSYVEFYAQMIETNSNDNFTLFYKLLCKIPSSEYKELCFILKTSLPSLTRQGVQLYLCMWFHLIDSCVKRFKLAHNDSDFELKCLTVLINGLIECASLRTKCSSTNQMNGLQDWDAGRRCAALQILQFILILCSNARTCRSHQSHKNESIDFTTVPELDNLKELCSSIHKSLVRLKETINDADTVQPNKINRLAVLGWFNEFRAISIQFTVDYLSDLDKLNGSPTLLLKHAEYSITIFDADYFHSIDWPYERRWNEAISTLVKATCSLIAKSNATILNEFIWVTIYPLFLKHISRMSMKVVTKFDPTVAQSLIAIALDLLQLSGLVASKSHLCSSANSKASAIPELVNLFSQFVFDTDIDLRFHLEFLKYCLKSALSTNTLLTILNLVEPNTHTDLAWSFLIALLIYNLYCCNNNEIASFDVHIMHRQHCLPQFFDHIKTYLPGQFANKFPCFDTELVLINIAAFYGDLSTFQDRMNFKSLLVKYFDKLCDYLCAYHSISSLSRDAVNGLYHQHYNCNYMTLEQLCGISYQLVGLLMHYCASLLYTPITGTNSSCGLQKLVNHFVLPRQLYELKDCLHQSSIDSSQLAPYVLNNMCEHLQEFTCGLAQLSWRSDAYLCRILKDIVRLYFTHLKSEAVASVVLNSPSSDFRCRVLEIISDELITWLNLSKQHLSSTVSLQSIYQQKLHKWLKFAALVHDGTHSLDVLRKDASYLVRPILLFLAADYQKNLNVEILDEAKRMLTLYKAHADSVDT